MQALDVPVLQMVEPPVEVVKFFSKSLPVVAEQVIEVPNFPLPDGYLQRVVPPEQQMAEQLVDVPTVHWGRVLLQLPSRSSLMQFRVVALLEEVFKVFPKVEVLRSVLWSRASIMVYTRGTAHRSELWNRPHTFLSLVVVVTKIFSRNRFQLRFLDLNMSMEVFGQGSRARRGGSSSCWRTGFNNRLVDAGLLDRSSLGVTLLGEMASLSQHRPSSTLAVTFAARRHTVGASSLEITCGSPPDSFPPAVKLSTWWRGRE